MPENRQLPVRPIGAVTYVVRVREGRAEHLILRRSEDDEHFAGIWQPPCGSIEVGETAWQTALRECREEAGLTPTDLYSANMTQSFYAAVDDCIVVFALFVGFVPADAEVRLSPEHDAYEWIAAEKGPEYFAFYQQQECLENIEKYFIHRRPSEYLRIRIPQEPT
jgi:dATP pyrophosphohydrolase